VFLSCISWLNPAALIWLRAQPPEAGPTCRSILDGFTVWFCSQLSRLSFRVSALGSQPHFPAGSQIRAGEPNDPGKMRWRGWSDLTARRFRIPRAQLRAFRFDLTDGSALGRRARARQTSAASGLAYTYETKSENPTLKPARWSQRAPPSPTSPRLGQKPQRNLRRDRNRPRPEP